MLLKRSPSEKALNARIAQGQANAGTDDADRPRYRSSAGSHLKDARRAIREREQRGRPQHQQVQLPNAPFHREGVSPKSQPPPRVSNSILGPLDRRIQEEPEIPPKNPARAGTAPVAVPSAGAVDEISRANGTNRSLSTPDASATNPGHVALGLISVLSSPRSDPRSDRDREDSRLPSLPGTGSNKPGDNAVHGANGQTGPGTVS